MTQNKNTLDGLREQINLYKELLELTKEEHKLLTEEQDTSELKEKQRKIRDKIQKLDIKYDVDQTDKLRLIKQNDIEELNQFEPVLKELYTLEKKNQTIEN